MAIGRGVRPRPVVRSVNTPLRPRGLPLSYAHPGGSDDSHDPLFSPLYPLGPSLSRPNPRTLGDTEFDTDKDTKAPTLALLYYHHHRDRARRQPDPVRRRRRPIAPDPSHIRHAFCAPPPRPHILAVPPHALGMSAFSFPSRLSAPSAGLFLFFFGCLFKKNLFWPDPCGRSGAVARAGVGACRRRPRVPAARPV